MSSGAGVPASGTSLNRLESGAPFDLAQDGLRYDLDLRPLRLCSGQASSSSGRGSGSVPRHDGEDRLKPVSC